MSGALRSIRRQRRRRRPVRIPRWRIAALAVLVAAGLAAAAWGALAVVDAPPLRVAALVVVGTERVPPSEVRVAAETFRGTPLLRVPLGRLREQIEQIEGVRDAVVARRLPDTLEILVHERVPVARLALGGAPRLVDRAGIVFDPRDGQPADDRLPELRGLVTRAGAERLVEEDLPALTALRALEQVTGEEPPAGTVVDLTPRDRIVLRPGDEAPALWLDRERPRRNLEEFFRLEGRIAELAPNRPIDLRFSHRLVAVPPDRDDTTRR
jgi:cell division septal protein FtsQ